MDSISAGKPERWTKRPDGLQETESTVFALDTRTGGEVWSAKVSCTLPLDAPAHYQSRDDCLAYSADTGLVLVGAAVWASALDAATGKPRWENRKMAGINPPILLAKTIIDQGGIVFDMTTGEPTGHRTMENTGCNYMIASKHLVFSRRGFPSYCEIDSTKRRWLRNTRSGCINNLIAADGLLNVPNYNVGCICNFAIQTSFAMVYMPEVAAWSGATPLQMTPPLAIPASAKDTKKK